jgi:hypothetical protein
MNMQSPSFLTSPLWSTFQNLSNLGRNRSEEEDQAQLLFMITERMGKILSNIFKNNYCVCMILQRRMRLLLGIVIFLWYSIICIDWSCLW